MQGPLSGTRVIRNAGMRFASSRFHMWFHRDVIPECTLKLAAPSLYGLLISADIAIAISFLGYQM